MPHLPPLPTHLLCGSCTLRYRGLRPSGITHLGLDILSRACHNLLAATGLLPSFHSCWTRSSCIILHCLLLRPLLLRARCCVAHCAARRTRAGWGAFALCFLPCHYLYLLSCIPQCHHIPTAMPNCPKPYNICILLRPPPASLRRPHHCSCLTASLISFILRGMARVQQRRLTFLAWALSLDLPVALHFWRGLDNLGAASVGTAFSRYITTTTATNTGRYRTWVSRRRNHNAKAWRFPKHGVAGTAVLRTRARAGHKRQWASRVPTRHDKTA